MKCPECGGENIQVKDMRPILGKHTKMCMDCGHTGRFKR